MSDAKEIIDAYDALIERALEVVGEAPYFKYVDHPCRLSLKGETALLAWPDTVHDYDVCSLEVESVEFPASLLAISEEELAAWRRAKRAEYDTAQKVRMAQIAAENERKERAEFERLKARFGA